MSLMCFALPHWAQEMLVPILNYQVVGINGPFYIKLINLS